MKGKRSKDLPSTNATSVDYTELLADIKERVTSAQVRAHLAVSRELNLLYWRIGRDIVDRQQREGWGKAVISRLAGDIQAAFPGIEGFSDNNIWRMRAFYLAYASTRKELAPAVQESPPAEILAIPWSHNIILVQKIKDPGTRLWYAARTVENGWSRNILALQIESDLHKRHGKAITNFKQALPDPQSDLAQQIIKDPYNFVFLTIGVRARERELKLGLMEHLSKFLVELGTGFAFVGRQVHLDVGGDDFYLDLLFYHLRLRCYVVVDLKRGAFKAEYASKMNFYLNVVDDQMRHADDQPSIGPILCQDRKRLVAEYALRGMTKAIGVSEYRLTRKLPTKLKGNLPTIEEIERELGKP
jgi:predicted nuclease of restriction endonuclease-like (RecB) superfamily